MKDVLNISCNISKLSGTIQLPHSKSITNRALILNYILKDEIKISNPSKADDSILLNNLLTKVSLSQNKLKPVVLNCNNAGTVFRFLTALLAATHGKWILSGSDRMKERPIKILVEALHVLGADIQYLKKEGFPPLQIKGKNLKSSKLELDTSVSSQFITAILLISPLLDEGLEIDLMNIPGSLPYIEMTIAMLNEAGIDTLMVDQKIIVRKSKQKKTEFICEPDWSAAAFWYEMVALSNNAELKLPGLTKKSLQGDAILPELFKLLGVQTTFNLDGIVLTKSNIPLPKYLEWDFTHHPDLAQAMIATCAGLNIQAKFTGLQSLVIKETNRLFAMNSELAKLGYQTKILGEDTLEVLNKIIDQSTEKEVLLHTREDHRMAMCLAPLVLKHKKLIIENPDVVSKSYPDFWEHLKTIGVFLK